MSNVQLNSINGKNSISAEPTKGGPSNVNTKSTDDGKAVGKELLKTLIAAGAGNFLEWFDFALFGLLADEIGANFFPESLSNTGRLIKSFAIFSSAFFMRPIGGAFFGYIGDKYGRISAMRISILLISIPTFLLGCLPTYNSIGIASTILLILIRIFQGLSVGGEFVGAITYIWETGSVKNRFFLTSLAECNSAFGFLIGYAIRSIMELVLTDEQIMQNWWRLPFVLGIFCAIFGLFIRRVLSNSREFEMSKQLNKLKENPLCDVLKNNKMNLIYSIIQVGFSGLGYYYMFIWMPTYVTQIRQHSFHNPYRILTIINVIYVFTTALGGYLADKFGLLRVLYISGISSLLAILITMNFMENSNDGEFTLILIVLAITFGIYSGTPDAQSVIMLHDTETRYTGLGISYNISMALFGGTAPVIATWLVSRYNYITFMIYVVSIGIISLGINVIWYYCKPKSSADVEIMHVVQMVDEYADDDDDLQPI